MSTIDKDARGCGKGDSEMNVILIGLLGLVVYLLLDILFSELALAIVGSIRGPRPWETIGIGVLGEIEYSRWEKIIAWLFGPIITIVSILFVAIILLIAFGVSLWHLITKGKFGVDFDYDEKRR